MPPAFRFGYAPERKLNSNEFRRVIQEHDIFQPELLDNESDHLPTLSVDTLRSIASIPFTNASFDPDHISSDLVQLVINAITSAALTPAEQALGSFTRRKLQKLDTWQEWRAGEHKQLDQFHALNMYGPPMPRPPNAIVLCQHWNYKVKTDGTQRPHNCCDRSKRAAPTLHKHVSAYSSCVMQPVQRIFML